MSASQAVTIDPPADERTDWQQQWTADGPDDLRAQFMASKATWLKSQTIDVVAQATDALIMAIGLMRSRKGPYVFDVSGDGRKGGRCTVKLRLAGELTPSR
jgi:hypothetical protein